MSLNGLTFDGEESQEWPDDLPPHPELQPYPGCGKIMFVAGTNGGQMPCGGLLRPTIGKGEFMQIYCDKCCAEMGVK